MIPTFNRPYCGIEAWSSVTLYGDPDMSKLCNGICVYSGGDFHTQLLKDLSYVPRSNLPSHYQAPLLQLMLNQLWCMKSWLHFMTRNVQSLVLDNMNSRSAVRELVLQASEDERHPLDT